MLLPAEYLRPDLWLFLEVYWKEQLKFCRAIFQGAVNFRAKNIESWDSLEENSIDLYASLKSLYLQNRKKKIANSISAVETQDDSDWEEIDTN